SLFFDPLSPAPSYSLSLHDALPIYRPELQHTASRPSHRSGTEEANVGIGITPELAFAAACIWICGILLIHRQLGLPLALLVVSLDRKSTRLNSSHVKISYAVFCLKK